MALIVKQGLLALQCRRYRHTCRNKSGDVLPCAMMQDDRELWYFRINEYVTPYFRFAVAPFAPNFSA